MLNQILKTHLPHFNVLNAKEFLMFIIESRCKLKLKTILEQYLFGCFNARSQDLSTSLLHICLPQLTRLNKFPEELNTMLQKRCVFKIKISTFNLEKNYHIYTVDKANTDPDVINVVLDNSTQAKEKNNANENETIEKITQKEKAEDPTTAINMVSNITSGLDLKRMRDTEDDDLLIISSTSNIAQQVPKLKIPKVKKD